MTLLNPYCIFLEKDLKIFRSEKENKSVRSVVEQVSLSPSFSPFLFPTWAVFFLGKTVQVLPFSGSTVFGLQVAPL